MLNVKLLADYLWDFWHVARRKPNLTLNLTFNIIIYTPVHEHPLRLYR